MRDELRRRREKHLLYLRMGLSYSARMERLSEEFGVRVNTVEVDETRMDSWVEDIANTASFEKKAAFLLYQHRSQTEAMEQLAQTANSERRRAKARADDQQEILTEYKNSTPAELMMEPAEYFQTLVDLARQVDEAEEDVFKWAHEERLQRSQVSDQAMQEFEARQSLGEIEKAADELRVDMEATVNERKVFAGIDLNQMPGIQNARLVGTDLDPDDESAMADIDIESTEETSTDG